MAQPQDIEKTPYQAVQQVDQPGSPSFAPPVEKRRSQWEKLGTYNFWVLIIGTIIILLGVALLAFLWFESCRSLNSDSGDASPLWVRIVTNDWTSRVVTLSTLAVRVALAAQLCVMAAIMAALILERVGASAEDLPLLSMIRCANTGPQALIWNVIHTVPKGSQLGYSLLIVTTILNTLALQFMSTILFTDFDNIRFTLLDRRGTASWGVNASRDLGSVGGSDYWRSGQSSFPTFVEYQGPSSNSSKHFDTGMTYRGFMPSVNETFRENLVEYSGPMTIVDERVICVKPTLSNAMFYIPDEEDDLMSADLTFSNIHPDVVQLQKNLSFNCTMPHSFNKIDKDYWHASICRLNLDVGELTGGISEEFKNETEVWLMFNATSPPDFNWTTTVADPHETVKIPLRQMDSPDGPWAKVGHPNMTVDVSVCLLNPQIDVYDVQVESWKHLVNADRRIVWDRTNERLNTSAVRQQLNVLGNSSWHVFDRGVFWFKDAFNQAPKLVPRGHSESQRVTHGALEKIKPWNSKDPRNSSFVLTPEAGVTDAIHRNDMWIVQDILAETRDPSKAMQALMHVVMQTAYYDWFSEYDLKAPMVYSITVSRYIPADFKHIAVVMALLLLHGILLVVSLCLFFIRTEVSLLGNSWQAIAQITSTDTAVALHHGAYATDQEVLEHVKKTGVEHRVIIRRSDRNGRTEAVALSR